ncbi:hypothetical protein DFH06DRAFT_1148811 [Mycena polygramma]|nr:hypothetical protein DFH06DRAFT_1148811 [Mycena polygramma]
MVIGLGKRRSRRIQAGSGVNHEGKIQCRSSPSAHGVEFELIMIPNRRGTDKNERLHSLEVPKSAGVKGFDFPQNYMFPSRDGAPSIPRSVAYTGAERAIPSGFKACALLAHKRACTHASQAILRTTRTGHVPRTHASRKRAPIASNGPLPSRVAYAHLPVHAPGVMRATRTFPRMHAYRQGRAVTLSHRVSRAPRHKARRRGVKRKAEGIPAPCSRLAAAPRRRRHGFPSPTPAGRHRAGLPNRTLPIGTDTVAVCGGAEEGMRKRDEGRGTTQEEGDEEWGQKEESRSRRMWGDGGDEGDVRIDREERTNQSHVCLHKSTPRADRKLRRSLARGPSEQGTWGIKVVKRKRPAAGPRRTPFSPTTVVTHRQDRRPSGNSFDNSAAVHPNSNWESQWAWCMKNGPLAAMIPLIGISVPGPQGLMPQCIVLGIFKFSADEERQ